MPGRAAFFEHALDMFFLTGPAGRILDANPAAEQALGYTHEELLALTIPGLCTPAQFEKARELFNSESGIAELDVLTKDGRAIPLEISHRGGCAVARDVGQRKLAAMSLLAGGVAHDFNNLLAGILGHASLLAEAADAEVRESADIIVKAANRAKGLTEQLLGFAARGARRKTAVDLHASIREVSALLRVVMPDNISLELALEARQFCIRADAGQIHQVLLNLAVNARDAMPAGGQITFRTATDGRHIRLSVCDTGPGVPPEIRHRIFEPYFTTKKRERGTGLGLAVVYGIVREHGGAIDVESELGQGSTFRLTFPLLPC
ncbi:MAG: ATP-binding protein [Bryobacteraceae bacterium]|nr:ATP-binding protein [Bryobacteraceae bacterium]